MYRMSGTVRLPSEPTMGNAKSLGQYSILYTWQAPTDNGSAQITTYAFTFTPEKGGPVTRIFDSNITSCTLDKLFPGISINATVKASNDGGVTYGPEFVFSAVKPVQ